MIIIFSGVPLLLVQHLVEEEGRVDGDVCADLGLGQRVAVVIHVNPDLLSSGLERAVVLQSLGVWHAGVLPAQHEEDRCRHPTRVGNGGNARHLAEELGICT